MNTGETVTPITASFLPNLEFNERQTVVLTGYWGNRLEPGQSGALYPIRVDVVPTPSPMMLVTPAGIVPAAGLGIESRNPYMAGNGPRMLAAKLNIEPLNVGLELGRRLAATPNNKRGFSAGELLREIADKERTEDPLLLDNLELLFEPSLQINPLDLVKRLAHSKRVVAVWPGELRGDRLVYADMSHPEHRDYSRDGVVVLEI